MRPDLEVHIRGIVDGWEQRCPVCEGRGVVPLGFYTGTSQSGTAPDECRRCNGIGTFAPESLRIALDRTTKATGEVTFPERLRWIAANCRGDERTHAALRLAATRIEKLEAVAEASWAAVVNYPDDDESIALRDRLAALRTTKEGEE